MTFHLLCFYLDQVFYTGYVIEKVISKIFKTNFFYNVHFILLEGMELSEKEAQKDYSIQEICLERTYIQLKDVC